MPSEPAPNGGPTRFDRAADIFHELRSLGLVERQALAIMDHPNIAKVFDGGATESGRPYFVMELVKGVPITECCDESTRGWEWKWLGANADASTAAFTPRQSLRQTGSTRPASVAPAAASASDVSRSPQLRSSDSPRAVRTLPTPRRRRDAATPEGR